MQRGYIGTVLFAAVLFVVNGCAPQTEVVKLYESRSDETKTYKRLLIVDVSPNQNQRVAFERELVATLQALDVEAIASSATLDADGDLKQEAIDRLSEETAADAILITHIASVETTAEALEGREEIVSRCRGGSPAEYFLYDHEVLAEPDSVKFAHTVVVISNLYDAQSRSRLWTIQSTCFDKASMSEVMMEEARAIARQLRLDKLV